MPRWIALTLASTVPFATIWLILTAFTPKPTEPPGNATNLAKYFQNADPVRNVLEGRTLWKASPGEPRHIFTAFAAAEDYFAMTDGEQLCTLALSQAHIEACTTFETLDSNMKQVFRLTRGAGRNTFSALARNGVMVNVGVAANAVPFVVQTLKVNALIQEFYWSSNEELTASGPFEDTLLRRFRLAAGEPRALTESLSGSPQLYPGVSRGIAIPLNETVMAVRPRADLIALGFRWSDRIRVHRADNLAHIRSIAGPVDTPSSFAIVPRGGKPVLTVTGDTALTYIDIAATDEAIVALYSGRYFGVPGPGFGRGNSLHVFSWDGRLLREVRLAADLGQIEVYHPMRALLGIAWDTDGAPRLVAFDLRAILGR